MHDAGPSQDHYAGQIQPSLASPSMYDQPRVTVSANYYTIPSSSTSAMPLSQQQEQDYASYAPDPVQLPPTQHRASSGAWSPQNDQQLLTARMQGLNWGQIKDAYFPTKTANACRKRHERLMERKGADDWDNRKLQQMAKEYMGMRKEIWSGLAARTGEKWNVVEQKVRDAGVTTRDARTNQQFGSDSACPTASRTCRALPAPPRAAIALRRALM